MWRQLLLSKPLIRFLCTKPSKSISRTNLSKLRYKRENQGRINLNSQSVLSSLSNCPGDIAALSFFLWCARQPNYFHDRYAFSHMVNVLDRLVQKFKSIDGVLAELEKIGCVAKPQTLLHLIRICWQGGMHDLVLEVIDTMGRHGYKFNNFACNVVMDIKFRNGQTESALRFLSEDSSPNFLSFNLALCNLCKSNDLVNIRFVLQKMLRAGYYPNVDTFVMILSCLCKMGWLKEANGLLGLMVILGIHDSVAVWNVLIDGVCKSGRPNLAECMLEKMISVGCSPNVMTYTSIIKGFMERKEVDKALALQARMESRGCEVDVVLCNVLMNGLLKLKMYGEALVIFHDLKKRNLEPDAYAFSCLVSTVCSSGRFHLLPKFISCFDGPADLLVLNSLLGYFYKAGFAISAVNFFLDMGDRGFAPDKRRYSGWFSGLCRAVETDEAVKLYRDMSAEGFELDAHIHTSITSELTYNCLANYNGHYCL